MTYTDDQLAIINAAPVVNGFCAACYDLACDEREHGEPTCEHNADHECDGCYAKRVTAAHAAHGGEMRT
jgi:hypothetical protein